MIQVTVGDLEKRLGVKYATALALVQMMVAVGAGREIGKRESFTSTGRKCMPSTLYELENTFTVSLDGVGVPIQVDAVNKAA